MTADPTPLRRRRRPASELAKTGGIVGVAALVFGVGAWSVSGSDAVGWLVTAVVALVVVQVPTRSEMRYSLSLAAVVAGPLLLWNPQGESDPMLIFVATTFGAFGLHAAVVALGGDLRTHIFGTVRHIVVTIIAAGAYAVLAESLIAADSSWFTQDGVIAIAITLASIVWFALDVTIFSLERATLETTRFGNVFALTVREWPAAMSMMATGALFGIALSQIDSWWWAVAITLIPYAMAHIAFLRAHETRRTYRQTIRALSRIPEVSAYSPQGHGDRTAALALTIGQELGLRPERLEDLEFAAQMHDIGRITLNQPSILRMGFTDEDIARWGSEMIGDVAYLRDVATLVRKQHEPYRRPGQERDPELPIGAKIIKAASAYDHATKELGFLPLEALEVLHRGAAYDYDPDVVSAIRNVLEREGAVPS
jgi:HD-GYP domain-containing protein (c-di-GMP phosphodiesterase class II)